MGFYRVNWMAAELSTAGHGSYNQPAPQHPAYFAEHFCTGSGICPLPQRCLNLSASPTRLLLLLERVKLVLLVHAKLTHVHLVRVFCGQPRSLHEHDMITHAHSNMHACACAHPSRSIHAYINTYLLTLQYITVRYISLIHTCMHTGRQTADRDYVASHCIAMPCNTLIHTYVCT